MRLFSRKGARRQKISHLFSRLVVVYCVGIGTIVTAAALIICYRAVSIPAGVVTALVGFWGGELLLLCLKRVLGDTDKDKPAEAVKAASDDTPTI